MQCRICEKAESRFWLEAKGHQIGRCEVCGFAQVLDVPNADHLSELYRTLHLKHLKYRSSGSAELENERRLALISQYLPDGISLLDAGCATGDFLAVAASRFHVYGSDVSSEAIEYARVRFPDLGTRLVAQPLEELGASAELLDAICLWDVIEHIADPITVLDNMLLRLKDNGLLFVSTPDFGSLAARLMRSNWAFMIPPLHLSYFSRRSFDYLFRNRISADVIRFETRGKLVDLAFLMYKLNQMSRWLAPQSVVDFVSQSRFANWRIYVPTNDIAYVVIRKPGADRAQALSR